MGKKIILIDGNNIAYRAFFALPPTIATSTGKVTNAVYGFTTMLMKLIEDQKPETIICAFDSKGPTFRHEIFTDYKATRKKMPDELTSQMPLIKEVLEAFNIKSIEMDGFEADDIIATIAEISKDKFDEVIIVSSDKDILQLVLGNIKVLAIKKGITDIIIFDKEKVEEKFGVEPSQIKDLLALMGDTSDNIPGIQGIGPKTAQALIEQFGNIEDMYRNIDELKNEKLRQLLINNENNARQSITLTELKTGLDINESEIFESNLGNPDYGKIDNMFNSLEFNTLKKRVRNIFKIKGMAIENIIQAGQTTESTILPFNGIKLISRQSRSINLSVEPEDFKKIINSGVKKIYITLINNIIPEEAGFQKKDFNGLIITDQDCNSYLLSLESLKQKEIGVIARKIIEDKSIIKSGFDLKQIWKFLKRINMDLCGKYIDFKILFLLLNPDKSETNFSEIIADLVGGEISATGKIELEINAVKDLQKNELNLKEKDLPKTQMEFSFSEEKFDGERLDGAIENINPVQNRKIIDYVITSSWFSEILKHIDYYAEIDRLLMEKLTEEDLDRSYYEIEEPLIKVLAEMEYKGVNIDREYLNILVKEYDSNIRELTGKIYSLCDSEFNINSTQQLSVILFEKLKLKTQKKTKTGYSTDVRTLMAIYDSHPVIEKILDYREKVKLKNTYIDVLPTLIDPVDGRVHTTYNQLGTTTGRISSNNPNLQNIPVRTELGKQIRKAFIPGKGYDLLLSADYSQIELRILAHLAEDEDLIAAFNSGEDIHTRTASEIFGIEYDKVDENMRRKAKAINFGIIYGMTEFGLKSRLSISEEEARDYISLYFARYPRIKKYISFLIESAYKNGFTTTMFGRRRYIKELATTNINIRNLGERLAVNTPIQGSAADIMKLATVILYNKLSNENLDSNIILHVHDEIVLELQRKDLGFIEKAVKASMENCIELKTRLKADIKVEKNWYI